MVREFQDILQTIEIVAEITTKFREKALLVSQYAADEEKKKIRYHDMKHDDILEFVSLSRYKTLGDMISRARERETELQLWKKHGPEQDQVVVGKAKRPKTQDS